MAKWKNSRQRLLFNLIFAMMIALLELVEATKIISIGVLLDEQSRLTKSKIEVMGKVLNTSSAFGRQVSACVRLTVDEQ